MAHKLTLVCEGRPDMSFMVEDEEMAMIDRLVGTGFGFSREEVIKNVLEHSLRRNQNIGRCDICGCVDHHLDESICPGCKKQAPGHLRLVQ